VERGYRSEYSGPNRVAMALYSDNPAVFGICTNSTSARGVGEGRVGTLSMVLGIVGQT
jgi:hypothetical protein